MLMLLRFVPLMNCYKQKKTIIDTIILIDEQNEEIFKDINNKITEKYKNAEQNNARNENDTYNSEFPIENNGTITLIENLKQLNSFIKQKELEDINEINTAEKLLEFRTKGYFISLINAKINDLNSVKETFFLNALRNGSVANGSNSSDFTNNANDYLIYKQFETQLNKYEIYNEFGKMLNDYTKNHVSCINSNPFIDVVIMNQLFHVIENQITMFNAFCELMEHETDSENDLIDEDF